MAGVHLRCPRSSACCSSDSIGSQAWLWQVPEPHRRVPPTLCRPNDSLPGAAWHLVEGMTRDSVLVMRPLGGSFSVNTSRVEVSASGLSSGCAGGSVGAGVLCREGEAVGDMLVTWEGPLGCGEGSGLLQAGGSLHVGTAAGSHADLTSHPWAPAQGTPGGQQQSPSNLPRGPGPPSLRAQGQQ